MEKKRKHGKALYQPSGAAEEYGLWACNLYNGCTNGCTYCYNKRGLVAKVLGADKVTLKSCLADNCEKRMYLSMLPEEKAFHRYMLELEKYHDDIMADGGEIFFSFVSDPCIDETIELTTRCILYALMEGFKVRVLTKCAHGLEQMCTEVVRTFETHRPEILDNFYVGVTLTGMDHMESNAAPNHGRIKALAVAQSMDLHTWASIEPVIDPSTSYYMMLNVWGFCEEFRIGLLSGKKRDYAPGSIRYFYDRVNEQNSLDTEECPTRKIIWKKSVMEYLEKEKE